MKKEYVRPSMVCETFAADEYVAACGNSGTKYLFKCEAGDGRMGDVWLETNGVDGLQTSGRNKDRFLSGYHACGITHEADSTDPFLDGYYVRRTLFGDEITPVIVWRGPKGDNTHCTTNLNMDSWEEVKS